MAVSEEHEKALQALGEQHGRIGHCEHEGHVLAFKAPDRVQARDFRRKADSPQEAPDRVDQLLQQTIIYIDGETDKARALQAFQVFLSEYPLWADGARAQTIVSVLSGVIQEEAATLLGKGCRVWKRTAKPSQTVSGTGSAGGPIQTQTLLARS